MPLYEHINGTYWVTTLEKIFNTQVVQRQIKINNPEEKPALAPKDPAFRQIYKAENGALYYMDKFTRSCAPEDVPKAQQFIENQRRNGKSGVAWYAKDAGSVGEGEGPVARVIAQARGDGGGRRTWEGGQTFDDIFARQGGV